MLLPIELLFPKFSGRIFLDEIFGNNDSVLFLDFEDAIISISFSSSSFSLEIKCLDLLYYQMFLVYILHVLLQSKNLSLFLLW